MFKWFENNEKENVEEAKYRIEWKYMRGKHTKKNFEKENME
jgi:hypothetical protein